MKDLATFYTELKNAGALTAAFAEAVKENTLGDFLKANDVDATAEEFMAIAGGEMDDEQLDAVAGGANWYEATVSILSIGVLCAVMAGISATGTGVGNGPNGQLLCNNETWI